MIASETAFTAYEGVTIDESYPMGHIISKQEVKTKTRTFTDCWKK